MCIADRGDGSTLSESVGERPGCEHCKTSTNSITR